MSDEIGIVEVVSVILATAEKRVARSEISSNIRGLFDIVYEWLRDSDVRQAGHNYAIYDECANDEMRLRVGFPVSARFTDTTTVRCSVLDAGRAAHARHVGPYAELVRTYRLLSTWCSSESVRTSGESWEIYGDWNDDPSKLVTDVFIRLA